MNPESFLAAWLALALAACGGTPAPATAEPQAGNGRAGTRSTQTRDLSSAIRAALGSGLDARYFDASVDLDGDGKNETVAYVAGPDVCGTGGCTIYVFRAGDGGYTLVSDVSVARVPVRVSTNRTHGWRDLVVAVGGGGMKPAFAVLKFDGVRYPSNPTVPPAVPATTVDGTDILIPDFETFLDGKPLPE